MEVKDYSKYNIYNTTQVLRIIGFIILISFTGTMIYAQFQIMEKKIDLLERRIKLLELMDLRQNDFIINELKENN